jgi:hypothetical protein
MIPLFPHAEDMDELSLFELLYLEAYMKQVIRPLAARSKLAKEHRKWD